MGLFDGFKKKKNIGSCLGTISQAVSNSKNAYADSSTISPDERPYYQPDDYYTFYSYPGTDMAVRVITFEERQKISFPSERGLYVAEIMLLDYCSKGKYPKPKGGYPGLWWFRYGIRDVGHTLESLETRGFIQWAPKSKSLISLKVEELKRILANEGLSASGKKAELVDRITANIPDERLDIPDYQPKYELTDTGKAELLDNGYVPYMHKHRHLTTEDARFGNTFTVWDINKLFPDGKATNWRSVVGNIEEERFGVNMANAEPEVKTKPTDDSIDCPAHRDEIRKYLGFMKAEIAREIKTDGDGFEEESQGLDLKAAGRDKEALVKFYIAIGKRFDAPALYKEAAVLLHKYEMYEEELSVLNAGLLNVSKNNRHRKEIFDRKKKLKELIKKNSEAKGGRK